LSANNLVGISVAEEKTGKAETLLIEARTPGGSLTGRILVADDQSDILESLNMLLRQHAYQVSTASSPAAILTALAGGAFDALLMDLNYARDTTSGQEGLHLLAQIRAMDEDLPIVVMTAWGSVELAVEAMKKGVGDFVLKPWDNQKLVETLAAQIEKGRERRKARQTISETAIPENEILEARKIQEGLLPKNLPSLPGFEISGAWQPSRIVGGDYYDVLELGNASVGLCIGDVVGKGMPAALLMSNLQAAIRGVATGALPPHELCSKVARGIRGNLAPEKFISLFYALLDAQAGTLAYANAGHNAPILVREDGTALRLDRGGPVIGVFAESGYAQGEISLASGDRLVLFTDGVTEASNGQDEEFSEERLTRLITDHRALKAGELQARILETISGFCQGNFHDDVTLLVLSVD
jgi:phosphoserine phosphatase RsbU/P